MVEVPEERRVRREGGPDEALSKGLSQPRWPVPAESVPKTWSTGADSGDYWPSPQKGHVSLRACKGFRQCQQKPFLGTSRALRRLRMSSSSLTR